MPVEQHPILERTGFALVGIADYETLYGRITGDRAFLAFVTETPLGGGLETRSTASTQA
jgi:hypothetical protein